MNLNPGLSTVEIIRKYITEKVVAEPVSNEIVEELRKEIVVLSAIEEVLSWDAVGGKVEVCLNLSYRLGVLTLKKRALVEMKSLEDQERLLGW